MDQIVVAGALGVAIANAAVNPYPHMRKSELYAVKNGWPRWVAVLTRSTQFYTMYAQAWFLGALHTRDPHVMHVAFVLNLSVTVLYYTLIWVDYRLLCYPATHEVARRCTGLLPPLDRHIIPWFGLHLQHGFAPGYLLHLGVPQINNPWLVVGVYAVYVCWHGLCWNVQGLPAYPIVYMMGSWFGAGVGFTGCVLYLSSMIVFQRC